MRPNLWHASVGAPVGTTPILLIPGALQCAREWPESFVNTLSSEGFRVIMIDHRDSGRNLWTQGDYNLLDMAHDVEQFVMNHRLKKLHLVGASMGGAIAQLVALETDVPLKSLTLLSTTPGRGIWDPGLVPPSDRAFEWTRKDFELQTHENIEVALEHRYTQLSGREKIPIREATLRARRVIRHGYHRFARHNEAFQATPARTGRLSTLATPTLIVHGSNDEVFPPPHAHLMHDCIPNASLHFVENMGHYISEANGAGIGVKIAAHARLHI